MPLTPPAPTLSGDLLTISRFLSTPAAIQRRLRDFRDLRFVSDRILTQRFRSTGGAVLYEQSEPFVTDRTVEAVGAGSEYPFANLPTGTAALAAIAKWGQKVRLTDEELARNVYGGAAIDRALRKVVNSIISQVDSITMSAVLAAIASQTTAGGVWSTSTTAVPLKAILTARSAIVQRNLGYNPDTVVVNDLGYLYLMTDVGLAALLKRETTDSPVYSGEIDRIAGMQIVVSPTIPSGQAVVLDSTQLGGMADEMDGAPGYSVADLAVQVKSIRLDANDAWDLQGRRKTVPVVQETGAAQLITSIT
jgi:hypothetical protein